MSSNIAQCHNRSCDTQQGYIAKGRLQTWTSKARDMLSPENCQSFFPMKLQLQFSESDYANMVNEGKENPQTKYWISFGVSEVFSLKWWPYPSLDTTSGT